MHGSVFCEGDADAFQVQQVVEEEIDRLVGQGRIAYGGAYALETFRQQVGDGEGFVGGISPSLAADMPVHLLYGGFGQTVGEGLEKQLPVGVMGKG